MMVTNLCTSPSSTIALKADTWVKVTNVPNVIGQEYCVMAYVHVTGGTISIYGVNGDISSSQRVIYRITGSTTTPMSMGYRVKSGNPTVTVTHMLICTWGEYQANKTLLDGIGYFTGDTMPLA